MGRFSRDEIEAAFRHYQVQGRDSARSGDWARWGLMFTEDVTYIEQQVGEWGGRWGIRGSSRRPGRLAQSRPILSKVSCGRRSSRRHL